MIAEAGLEAALLAFRAAAPHHPVPARRKADYWPGVIRKAGKGDEAKRRAAEQEKTKTQGGQTMKRSMIMLAAALIACGGGTEPAPSLVVDPPALSFSATGATLASQSLGLVSTGAALQWTAAGNAPWLSFSPAAGMTPSTITVSPSPTGLAGGTLSATITIQSPGASAPQSVPVSLAIPTATGGWTGNNAGVTVSVVLAETGGAVSGSGTLAGTSSVAVTVAGTHAHPTLSLTFTAPGFQPSVFIGSYTASNTVSGMINGSGFVNFPMTLTR